ncbi:hypothetical protein HMPREF9582_00986 [Cutibacterium acnes HL060PA1]|nr:hypothetical protein HMPREF9619_00869 [Cutibacterium acnes HL082PA2]EFT65149.1 hypothetical protein HMPREF9582_00986 [Cutibacterium acnes HL060PA1]
MREARFEALGSMVNFSTVRCGDSGNLALADSGIYRRSLRGETRDIWVDLR